MGAPFIRTVRLPSVPNIALIRNAGEERVFVEPHPHRSQSALLGLPSVAKVWMVVAIAHLPLFSIISGMEIL
jgi:hypothetical protein